MKKFLSILLVLALTLSVAGMAMAATNSSTPTTPTKTTVTETKTETTTTAAAPAAPAPDHAQLKTNSAHLRETPGGKYNIGNDWIGAGTTLELAGDAVTVDGQTWIPVVYNGKVWYVADYLVNLVVGATTAPAKKTVTSAGSSSSWTGASSSETTADDGLKLEILGETTESASVFKAFQDAAAAGNVLSALPDDVKAKLVSGVTQINEMVAAKFVGDVNKVTGSVLVNVRFSTLYSPAGEKVSVIINKAGAWTVVEGTIQGDGSISMTVTKDMLNTLKNDEFVIGVVSK